MRSTGKRPDGATYVSLLKACDVTHDLPRALQYFSEMLSDGLVPDGGIYNMMIACCASGRDADRAFTIADSMEANGLKLDQYSFTSLLDACAATKDIARAIEVLQRMSEANIPATLFTYNTLIKLYASLDQLDLCATVLSDLTAAGLRPDSYSFGPVVCSQLRDLDLAGIRATIDRMIGVYGLTPTAYIWNVALECAAKVGDRSAGQALLAQMSAVNHMTGKVCAMFDPPLECSHLPLERIPRAPKVNNF